MEYERGYSEIAAGFVNKLANQSGRVCGTALPARVCRGQAIRGTCVLQNHSQPRDPTRAGGLRILLDREEASEQTPIES